MYSLLPGRTPAKSKENFYLDQYLGLAEDFRRSINGWRLSGISPCTVCGSDHQPDPFLRKIIKRSPHGVDLSQIPL